MAIQHSAVQHPAVQHSASTWLSLSPDRREGEPVHAGSAAFGFGGRCRWGRHRRFGLTRPRL